MRRSILLSSLLFSMFFGGCKSDATQILVVVDSDLRVPDELRAVHARVFSELGAGVRERDDELFELSAGTLPLSFGVAPLDASDGVVVVVLDAIGPNGLLFSQRAVTRFQEGKTLLLHMVLHASCQARFPCPVPTDTCRAGVCGSDAYPGLVEVEPGEELAAVGRYDGGPRPMAQDGGTTDAGIGSEDAAPVNDDASMGSPDAAPAPMDAAPGGMDAAPPFPDAAPMFPDAAPPFADAAPAFPDAAPVFPDARPPLPDAMMPPPPDAGMGPPDSGMMTGPSPCTSQADCELPQNCPPDAQSCGCRPGPPPGTTMVCIPLCSAANPMCPTPPGAPMPLTCDTAMGVCMPP